MKVNLLPRKIFFSYPSQLIYIPGEFGIISLFPTNNLSGPFWVSSPKFEVSSCCEGVATRAWVEGVAWEGVELGVELLFFFFILTYRHFRARKNEFRIVSKTGKKRRVKGPAGGKRKPALLPNPTVLSLPTPGAVWAHSARSSGKVSDVQTGGSFVPGFACCCRVAGPLLSFLPFLFPKRKRQSIQEMKRKRFLIRGARFARRGQSEPAGAG